MVKLAREALTERTVWFLIGSVVLCVLIVLLIVYKHETEKPRSPQALAAAAFSQFLGVKEWQPGMGKQPFMYHPAALRVKEWKPGMGQQPFMYHPAGFNRPEWRPLPARRAAGPVVPTQSPRMNQNAIPFPGPGMP